MLATRWSSREYFRIDYLVILILWFLPLIPLHAIDDKNQDVIHQHHGDKTTLPSDHTTDLLLTIRNYNFVDNIEYFNKIMEGETIFGLHFFPSISLQITPYIGLDVGLVWKKYFGQIKPWGGITPMLSTYYKNKCNAFVMGIFYLKDYQPTLIEPLWSFHNLLRRPFIEGIHFRVESDKTYLSGWLDWLTLLSKKKSIPETFTFHLDTGYQFYHTQKIVACTIFQLAIYHLGGQGIPIKDYSLFAGSSGLLFTFMPPNSFFKKITCAGYLLLNRYVKTVDRPSKGGHGQLYTFNCAMRWVELSMSYWHGTNFSSENMGYPLYQSIRIENNTTVTYYEPSRELLLVSLHKNWIPFPDITIEAAFRPYYDCKNQLFEYGFSFGLSYSGNFRLTTLHYAAN